MAGVMIEGKPLSAEQAEATAEFLKRSQIAGGDALDFASLLVSIHMIATGQHVVVAAKAEHKKQTENASKEKKP